MATFDITEIAAGQGGFVLTGEFPGDRAHSPAPAGDVNDDGIADFVVGAPQHFTGEKGKAYVVFGGQSFEAQEPLAQTGVSLSGFQILGESDWSCWVPRSAGDVNGDGRDDLVVSATFDAQGGDYAGASYVVFGKEDMEAVDLADVAAGRGGFKIPGVMPGGYMGYGQTATGIGDVNQDGLADVLVGVTTDVFWPGPGEAYVVFGKRTTETVELEAVKRGVGGFLISPAGPPARRTGRRRDRRPRWQ